MDALLSRTPELRNADQRAFLYSDLSQQKTDNPEGYQEAVGFWSKFLLRACKSGLLSPTTSGGSSSSSRRRKRGGNSTDPQYSSSSDEDDEVDVLDRINSDSKEQQPTSVLCIDRKSLETRLTYKGDTPAGLEAIVDEMVRREQLQPIDVFFATAARRWLGWIASRIPLMPRQLAAMATGGGGHARSKDGSLLVVVPLVEAAAERILDEHYSSISYPLTDSLMSVQEFRERFSTAVSPKATAAPMASVDADILVKHLVNSGRIIAAPLILNGAGATNGSQMLIKFAASRGQTISESYQPITEADRGAYQVIRTRREIEKQVHVLESRASDLDQQVREALKRKQKPLAIAKLRLKKHLENDVLAKRLGALETIEKVALQLQQTSSDIQLMQALEAGTKTLRGLNEQADLASADRIFDDWAEEALKASEFEGVMNDGAALVQSNLPESVVGEDVDEELEAELDALVAASGETPKPIAAEAEGDDLADALSKVAISSAAAEPSSASKAAAKWQEQRESREGSPSERVAVPA
ncbi:hypothetical protein GQ54DRAFT_225801 [Martensiomyces pterosporus]|nr:hypothetical protein GQ54DRAFT_225801 [Martensiomyces pterosporus]